MSTPRPIRLWPAWVILAIQAGLMIFTVMAEFDNFSRFVAMMAGPLACGIAFVVYLLLASRLRLAESGSILICVILGAAIAWALGDPSIGSALWIYGLPLAMLVVTLTMTWWGDPSFSSRINWPARLGLLCWAAFLPARLDGFDGTYFPEFASRWSPAVGSSRPVAELEAKSAPTSEPIVLTEGDWPGFRGPQRDSRVVGQKIRDDWEKTPPQILWKIKVGPAWSSMAVVGDSIFTQEQIGDQEAVVSYERSSGKERWRRTSTARFHEIVSGPGPRATPTFHDGLVYSIGGTGQIEAIDARTGELQWKHSLKDEYNAELNMWGYACSPLVAQGQVILYSRGAQAKGWIAFDAKTGKETWSVPTSGENYSSAQLFTIGEVTFLVLITEKSLVGVDPATGKVLWEHTPAGWSMAPMVQPHQVGPASLVVSIGDGTGSGRFSIIPSADSWKVEDDWTSKNLKPSFNDFVQFEDALFGFDQNIFACIDAASGKRLWKKGRYGFGQCLLFEESKAILIVTETGEIVLIAADPKQHRELGTFQAVEGKTWNHPAFAQGVLYVRSGEEMAAVDLSTQ
jgi:outer membrane protein assembly factor BamB